MQEQQQAPDAAAFSEMKHDINNQLSNINLALEQLRYELKDAGEDVSFYLDTIKVSCNTITRLLKG